MSKIGTCEDNTAVLHVYARQTWPKITFKLLLKRHLNGYNYNIIRATATKFSVYMLFGERFKKNMFSVRCAVFNIAFPWKHKVNNL